MSSELFEIRGYTYSSHADTSPHSAPKHLNGNKQDEIVSTVRDFRAGNKTQLHYSLVSGGTCGSDPASSVEHEVAGGGSDTQIFSRPGV